MTDKFYDEADENVSADTDEMITECDADITEETAEESVVLRPTTPEEIDAADDAVFEEGRLK